MMRVPKDSLRGIAAAISAAVIFSSSAQAPATPASGAHATPATNFAPPNLTPAGVRSLAATCAPCHGTNGASAGGNIPALAGSERENFVAQIQSFKDGKRQSTVMQQLAKGYDDAEIAALADYFAAQKK